jgi:hypothetical protein
MNTSIVTLQYNNFPVLFQKDASINATAIAKQFNKSPKDYLRLDRTKDYIEAVRRNRLTEENQLVTINQGGTPEEQGTWIHRFLAIDFARWLNSDFAVWCDMQIESLLKPVPNALRDLPPKTLTPAMLRHIEKRITHLNKTQVGSTYASLGRMIKEKFNVNERKAIPIHKYREVCVLLGCEPDEKALQGELVEPAKLEYQPPKGMVLIAESELSTLQERRKTEWNGDGYASMILGINDNSRLVINPTGDVTTIMRLTENDFVGTFETIVRELKLRGYHVIQDCPQNKLETIGKIVTAKFEA